MTNSIFTFTELKESSGPFTTPKSDVLAYHNINDCCIKAIHTELIQLLSTYAASDGFHAAPDGSNPLLYYRRKVDRIESIIHQIYNNDTLVNTLMDVTRAIKYLICSSDFPGIPNNWFSINPNLRFYTAGFTVFFDAPEMYERIKNCELSITLDYYPNLLEITECYHYFKELKNESDNNNYRYNITDFFQQELIRTIKMIFANEILRT